MTDERWQRAKALFQAAVERPIEERVDFLGAATGGDDALRREVESLLASDTLDGGFLDHLPVASETGLADSLAVPPASMDHAVSHTTLTAGARVGAFEILAPLGAGAMGDVYRACDTNLNREVALKVLPTLFALDPDRLARFNREAQVLATLSHPNIAAIYGLESSNGAPALVLELVDGTTLADRIALGPIPLREALAVARQIAEALEAAHEKSIIHRDLKPANVKIASNGVVKVLDFGLAKVWDGAPRSNLSASPTLTATDMGEEAILGTPAYMSPEQARGKPLDRRTDLWSFGCVLYEMLTGRAPFAGDTISDTIAAILERAPDLTLLPPDTPVPIRRLLRRCLEKDRNARLDSAAGAQLEIADAIAFPDAETPVLAQTSSGRVRAIPIAAVAGGTAIAACAAWALMRPVPVTPMRPSRFAIVAPAGQPLNVWGNNRDLAISADGRHLVYRSGGTMSAGGDLTVRTIDRLDAQPLAGVVFAYAPFISPDARWIGFFENTDLKKVPIAGGPVTTVCRVSGVPLGASWGDDNIITFATDNSTTGLWRVSADGAVPTVLTKPDAARREGRHAFPSVLPRGRGVIFTIRMADQTDSPQVAVLDLKTGRRKTLIRGGSDAQYVETGHLIFASAGSLRAVRFDLARLEVLGDPITVVDRVLMKSTGATDYAVSRQGTLVYVPSGTDEEPLRMLVWVDRKGREEHLKAPLRAYGLPRISPDGTRVVVAIYDQENSEIWIWDLVREMLRRLTFSPGMDGMPFWTPDGRQIIFHSERTGVGNIYGQAADGNGNADALTSSPNPQWPTAISPDGTWLAGFDHLPRRHSDIVFFPLRRPLLSAGAGTSPGIRLSSPEPADEARFPGWFAEFSPNGRYVAYKTDESGQDEVYVRPFPQVTRGRWQISIGGGSRPAWSRSGRELFYIDGSNALTTVPVQMSGSTFSAGKPVKIFDTKYAAPNPGRHYDVSSDGQRFLMIKSVSEGDPNATPASMVVVLDWFEELKQRVSTNNK
jgi:eukaryotic-like serine/threonine-protein kinase